MIYNSKFVWLHFPKTAGTKIQTIFKKHFLGENDVVQDLTSIELNPAISWHDSIKQRQERDMNFVLGERTVICGFRRLPNWLESRYSYEMGRSPTLEKIPEDLLKGYFLEQSGERNHADEYVNKYLSKELLNTSKVKFIRVEHFADDFKSAFGEFIDVSKVPDLELTSKVNTSMQLVPPHISSKLRQPSSILYESRPLWAAIEKSIY